MTALVNIAFMGASTLLRLIFGVLTFALMARLLGPNAFGSFMLLLSVATLLALIANYGFTPYLLREIGANSAIATKLINEVVSAKLLICLAIAAGGLCALLFIDPGVRWGFLALLLAMLVESFTDLLNVRYRVTNRFSSEARIATIAAASQFLIVTSATYYQREITIVAIAFLASRLAVLLITWLDQLQYFANLKPAPLRGALRKLKAAFSYACDLGLQSLIGQVDSLVLNHFAGPVAVGLHQAGMRIFLGGGQVANVLGNVFIPKLSGLQNDAPLFNAQAHKLQSAFLISGGLFGLTLATAATPIVHVLYGDAYTALIPMLPWFGLLFVIRFFAAAYGVLLTSAGKQTLRAKANIFHWFAIFLSAWLLVPPLGNIGWILALLVGNLMLTAMYSWAMRSVVVISRPNAAIVVGSVALIAPFLHVS